MRINLDSGLLEIKGLKNQMRMDGRVIAGGIGNVMPAEEDSVEWGQYYDDISGEALNPQLVKKAREEEMREFKKHGVYTKVDIQEAWRVTGKGPIDVRWVDINKGDIKEPEYRSRLVAKEINRGKREDLFAATPPLEAKKVLFTLAVTEGVGIQSGRDSMKLDFIDVRRAYFHALSRREVYIKLPDEDREEGKCGKLNKSMYGTRDAAQNWEFAYVEFMEEIGFKRGVGSPCVFWNADQELRAVIHGDDVTVLGHPEQLDWFRSSIQDRFEVKFRGRLGPGIKDDKSIRILNRVVEWTDQGIKYEADQRHAEIIIKQLGLNDRSKPVVTPGSKETGEDSSEEALLGREVTLFRAMVARANYLAQDRSDIGIA